MPKNKIIKKNCFVCHNESNHIKRSTFLHPDHIGPSGIVDLDGRPKELTEYILKNFLEICPHCGYVAENIEEQTSVTSDYLNSPEYQNLMRADNFWSPILFLRAAFIKLGENKPEKAINYYLYAAWCADSLFKQDIAIRCRKKALYLIFENNKSFADIPSKKWIQIIDIIRRCGDFQTVINHCLSILPIAGHVLQLGLEYELLCAKNADHEVHTNIDAATVIQYRSSIHNPNHEFIIGGKSYSIEENCHGSGWHWVAETRTFILSNYHGTAIEAPGDIIIRVEKTDNQITCFHGPCIHIKNGNLTINGLGILSIKGEEEGIMVSSGTLEIGHTVLDIQTKGTGICTSGTIFLTKPCVVDIQSEKTGMRSVSGGLHSTLGPVIKVVGICSGMDIHGDITINTGLYHIESSDGPSIIIQNGLFSAADCILEIISGETGIQLQNGKILFDGMRCYLHGNSGIEVNGQCNFENSLLTISSKNSGLSVSRDVRISGGRCEISGKTPIFTKGNLQMSDANITVSGETAIFTEGDVSFSGGILILNGDTAMHISRNFEISRGLVIGVGKIRGIIIEGTYTQSGGDISITGESQEGMKISGKEMIITSGILTISGRETGLDVSGDVLLLGFTLSTSGITAFSIGGSLKMDKGELKVNGEEIGLSLKGGILQIGTTLSVTITGNTGVYVKNDIEISGSSVNITGQFAGIVQEKGDLKIKGGKIEISAEEYGILIQSGSMTLQGGVITVTNTRMMDLGGVGIMINNGNMNATSLMEVNGESLGISVPCGEIGLKFGRLKSYGFRTAIIANVLKLDNFASLTAYGKTEGAIVLLEGEFQNNDQVHVWAGTSEKTAKDEIYTGQRYIHAYTDNPGESDNVS